MERGTSYDARQGEAHPLARRPDRARVRRLGQPPARAMRRAQPGPAVRAPGSPEPALRPLPGDRRAAGRGGAVSPRLAKELRPRNTYLGATDIAAIAGVSPYRKPFDVYLEKI